MHMLLTPNATRQSIALLVVLLCLGAAARGAVAQTAADGWSGEVQCTVAVRAPGYQDDLIHTWTVSTLPTARNDFRDYPATWTLTGSGTRAIPAAVRTGAGAAPEKWDRKAVDSNSSITLFVPGDRTSLRIAPGQRPVRAAGELRVAGASSPMSA